MVSNSFKKNSFNKPEIELYAAAIEEALVHPSDVALLSTSKSDNEILVQTQVLEGRKRRLSASIIIPHSVESIWQVLTDYDRLADFIPNLKESRRIECPEGRIHIEQIGSQSFLQFKFCARVVLDMIENFPTQIDFQMVEGDFKEFCGQWLLNCPQSDNPSITGLTYVVDVLPSRLMPINVIEKKLSHNLQVNMAAIYKRVNDLFG